MAFRLIPTTLPEVLLIEPDVYRDDRGFFLETYRIDHYRDLGLPQPFVQDNHSRSERGVLRGLHWQYRRPQGKLVRAIEGEVFDVAVDVRPESPTFRQWVGMWLSAANFRLAYIPPGFAHGFCVTSDVAQITYKCTELYDPEGEQGVSWDDPAIGIEWPIAEPTLSARDRGHPTLEMALYALGLRGSGSG